MKIPIRSNGKLTEHGYHDVRDKTELTRHRALGKVIRAGEPPLGLFRRLNVQIQNSLKFSSPIETG